MQLVYADASSLILLEKAHLLDICLTCYRFVLPASVYDEISNAAYPDAVRFQARVARGGLQVVETCPPGETDIQLPPGISKLDRGERDTIALFVQKKEGFILTDDGAAARLCSKNHLPFINALLVPKLLAYAGHITMSQCQNRMAHLCRMGRYSEKITAFAADCTMHELKRFLPKEGP